jgi:hypothetical protein
MCNIKKDIEDLQCEDVEWIEVAPDTVERQVCSCLSG